jgi:hypothetical protein
MTDSLVVCDGLDRELDTPRCHHQRYRRPEQPLVRVKGVRCHRLEPLDG